MSRRLGCDARPAHIWRVNVSQNWLGCGVVLEQDAEFPKVDQIVWHACGRRLRSAVEFFGDFSAEDPTMVSISSPKWHQCFSFSSELKLVKGLGLLQFEFLTGAVISSILVRSSNMSKSLLSCLPSTSPVTKPNFEDSMMVN